MKFLILTVATLGCAVGQQQRATYFEAPAGVASAEACKAYWQANPGVASTSSSIFTRPTGKKIVDLCIHFLSRDIWRYDPGLKGNCRGECCEWVWFDPSKGEPRAPPRPWLQWFFDLRGDCSDVANAEATPWIFTNTPSGQYQVCMRPVSRELLDPSEDFSFRPVAVTVDERNCGGPGGQCCPFTVATPDAFPFKPRAPPAGAQRPQG